MRYDINISLVVSIDAFDLADAADRAERLASHVEAESVWLGYDGPDLPTPLAIVEEVTPVND